MKKNSLLLTCLLLFSGLSFFTFSSCDSDTNCYISVTVVDETAKTPISNCDVSIGAEGGNIEAQKGKTDAVGHFEATFPAPAIVTVDVKKIDMANSNENTTAFRAGKSSARLKEGETVEVTVSMPSTIYYE